VTAGQTAAFSVSAIGTAPLTYQWRMNGAAIKGATSSSYTTPATTTSENGSQFTVVVSNSAGSATSSAAVLTVNAAASILNSSATSLAFGSVNLSSSNSQSVTLTNAGSSSVTISNVMVAGAGFGASGVSSGLILSAGQSAALSATFDPAASGSATGSITVTSNAANSPMVIALSGTGIAPTSYSVLLTWAESTSSVTGYNVYSSTVSGGPYTKVTPTPVASTDYTDSSVKQGNTYYYVVTAVNSQNQESSYSSQVSASVP
jgi:Cep192 domain 4